MRRLALVAAIVGVLAAASAAGADEGTQNLTLRDLRVTQSTTQAGGHPDVGIFFRICGPGIEVTAATKTDAASPVIVTLARSPGATPSPRRTATIRGALGAPGLNGQWDYDPVAGRDDQFLLRGTNGVSVVGYVPSSARSIMGPNFDCANEERGFLKDFRLNLPPGFLGNPTANTPCPVQQWNSTSITCPLDSMVGFSWANALIEGGRGAPLLVTSPVFNVETLGLEPARLGTGTFPGDPAGPFPVLINVRTSGDRGIDSTLNNIPRNLGGPTAITSEIFTALCARVPCRSAVGANQDIISNSMTHDPAASRPFFVNPTSCGTKTFGMTARSWRTDATTSAAQTTITTDGCERVPFDLGFGIGPSPEADGGDTAAGRPSAQDAVLAYPRASSCPPVSVEPDCWYENEEIWQSQLKDVRVMLPSGLRLSPGAGAGLEACTYAQFGVDESGRQLDDEPARCPPGSQIGTLTVRTPVDFNPIGGKVFFGPATGPGRPTAERPWKLFLLIEGSGLRMKLAGDVIVAEDGTISNVFVDQPELPFGELRLRLKGGPTAPLMNPDECGRHEGSATLTGWSGATSTPSPVLGSEQEPQPSTNCPPAGGRPFGPLVADATATPKQAGASTVSKIVIERPDGDQDIRNMKLSLPGGAIGSLAAVPKCRLADARAGNCSADTRIGTIRNTVGNGDGLLTVEGGLYLGEASQPGDAASIVVDVPARAGPIDLGDVVVLSRVVLRQSDAGVDVISSDIPRMFEGVPLPLRKLEITVDRPGFFLNPTGCEPRPLIATFESYDGATAVSTRELAAENCDALPFDPQLRLIAGAPGLTGKGSHPPLTAIVTQRPGEAAIRQAKVLLPDILRPNSPELNEPGGLCAEAEFAARTCPPGSVVGSARAITPLLPFELAGPVYIAQETVDPLPRLFVLLRGGGFEVPLRARNFFEGIRVANLFEAVPDVPNSYFELKIDGGPDGILNAFFDMCRASPRAYDARFTGHNGKTVVNRPLLEVNGCDDGVRAASIKTGKVRIKNGIAKVRVSCRLAERCRGRLTLRSSGKVRLSRKSRKRSSVTFGSKRFDIPARKSRTVNVKVSSKGMKALRVKHRQRVRATARITGASAVRAGLTLVR